MAAADAGKHILIEKPLAMTSEEGQKVVEYCRSKGVKARFGVYAFDIKDLEKYIPYIDYKYDSLDFTQENIEKKDISKF